MGRTYKFYISGSVSEEFFQKMWEELPAYIDDPGVITLSNPLRSNNSTTFEMFISSSETGDSFYTERVDSAKEWIVANQVYYEVLDIGT